MRNLHLIILALWASLAFPTDISAQTENTSEQIEKTRTKVSDNHTVLTSEKETEIANDLLPSDTTSFTITAPIPMAGTHPFFMYGITPLNLGGYANWDLHKGFNASIGMSVSVGLGKHALSGVGFGQDAAFLYAVPLNNRVSVAGGVYATNMDWGNYSYRNVGVAGIVAFKATDRITLYGYGNKSIMPQRRFPAYPLPNFTPDKFGGMVNFKVGESASFSIGVEAIKNDHPYGYYFW